jgi:hypothetical protein
MIAAAALAAGCGRAGIGDGDGSGGGPDGNPPGPPDAARGTPVADAAPPPDAPGPDVLTMVFGEGDGTDVQGVTHDTKLAAGHPTYNFGIGATLRCDGDPAAVGLIKFDISRIPAGSIAVSAELAVTTGPDPLDQGSVEVYVMSEGWNEGSQDGAAGTASWNDRKASTPWTTAGAGVGSRESKPAAQFIPGTAATTYTTGLPAETIQSWIDTPSVNHGVVLVPVNTGTTGVNFVSSEGDDTASRPRLTVHYMVP